MSADGLKALRLDALTKRYGSLTAVRELNLEIQPGEMVSVIGPSGAGKSTLLRLITRLLDPSSGRVLYGDRDVATLQGRELLEWRSRCGMVFQHFHLSGRLDVATNVLMGRLRHNSLWRTLGGWFPREDRLRAARALERVGLLDKALERADRLSGGQMQRVAVARALAQEPAILLADEPISALDPDSARGVMELLKDINSSDGVTVLCNLHNLEAARQYSTRIVGMREGTVVFDGLPERLGAAEIRLIYGVPPKKSVASAA